MLRRKLARMIAGAMFVALHASACGAIVGINDLIPGQRADGASGDGAIGDDTSVDPDSTTGTTDGGEDGGACGDILKSKEHCGRCGHSCLGGECAQGVCQPIAIATAQGQISAIAIDATNVYFASSSNSLIARVAKSGGNVSQVATSNAVLPRRVAVNATHVYWTADQFSGVVARCPVPACTGAPQVIANPAEPIGLALTTTHVYWADRNSREIRRALLGGGTAELVAQPSDLPIGLAVDGTTAFSVADFSGSVDRSLPDAGVLPIGANGQSGRDLVLDATHVYWSAAQDPGLPGRISRAPRAGGGPVQTLSNGNGDPSSLAIDSTHLYWTAIQTFTDGGTGSGGGIYACALPTCAGGAQTIASAQNIPRGIAVDGDAIYWGTNVAIMKIAKP